MVWTSPRTWVAGETVTAALLNLHLRDNLKALGDAWTSWGSGASWTGSSSNPAIGNGTWSGKYLQVGKFVEFSIEITMGSTTTYGTGNWQLALPVPEATKRLAFAGIARDESATSTFPLVAERTASGVLTVRCDPTTAGNAFRSVTSANPFTWASTDVLFISGSYEAA